MREREMKRNNRLFAIVLPCGLGFFPQLVRAQKDKGSLIGHITVGVNSVLKGAELEIQPGNLTVVSNSQGAFYVNGLSVGTYTITVTHVGFSRFTTAVTVSAGQPAMVDVKMDVESQKDQILVTAERAQYC
jgi:hypothetical protein